MALVFPFGFPLQPAKKIPSKKTGQFPFSTKQFNLSQSNCPSRLPFFSWGQSLGKNRTSLPASVAGGAKFGRKQRETECHLLSSHLTDQLIGDTSDGFLGMIGSKSNHSGTAGFSPCFHLPEFRFGYPFLTHSLLTFDQAEANVPKDVPFMSRSFGIGDLESP